MATTLVNMQRRRQLFELRHPVFFRPRWGYAVTTIRVSEHNPRTGEVGFREVKRKLSGTLTLLGGDSIADLPDEIASVPAIRDAVRAGKVRLIVAESVATTKTRTKPSTSSSRGRGTAADVATDE